MQGMNQPPTSVGKVFLVGAGPGDPGLITLRGAERLARADVVLYDYLANTQLLTHAAEAAEKICVGKHGGGKIWTQSEINDELVRLASAGKNVVRLKGGDPAIFARAAEEAAVLKQAGVPFEVIPGVTAALAAGSYTGVPLTHRDHASAVAFITGQERPDKETSAIDYDALARFPGTLVFYMGVTTADHWSSELQKAGKPADTPAVIVRRCSLPDQQTIFCRLDEVAAILAPTATPRIRPPVVVAVGQAVQLGPELAWFTPGPLAGKRVLVTRPREQADALAAPLRELGAEVIVQPMISIDPPDDWAPVDEAIDQFSDFDWLLFSSTNGVRYFFDRLLEVGHDMRRLGGIRIAAVGSRTAEALASYRLNCDVQPDTFDSDALAKQLIGEAAGKRFLSVRASRGGDALAEEITTAGGVVEEVVAYSHRDVTRIDDALRSQMAAGEIGFTTVTSSAIARSLAAGFGDALHQTRLISISPITSQAIRDAGFQPAAEAPEASMEGVVQAIAAINEG